MTILETEIIIMTVIIMTVVVIIDLSLVLLQRLWT